MSQEPTQTTPLATAGEESGIHEVTRGEAPQLDAGGGVQGVDVVVVGADIDQPFQLYAAIPEAEFSDERCELESRYRLPHLVGGRAQVPSRRCDVLVAEEGLHGTNISVFQSPRGESLTEFMQIPATREVGALHDLLQQTEQMAVGIAFQCWEHEIRVPPGKLCQRRH